MAKLLYYEKIFSAPEGLRRPTANVMYLRSPVTGTLDTIRLIVPTSGFTASWYFNVRKNGVALYGGTGRILINPSNLDSAKTAQNIAVTRGDVLQLDLEQTGAGVLSTPIVLLLGFADPQIAEEVVTYTTGTLADGATENAAVNLGKAYSIHKISVDRSARVRVYLNGDYRTADAGRPIGTDPDVGTEHGVVCDVNLVNPNLTWDLAPIPLGSNRETPQTSNAAVAIQNRSGASAAVTVNFTILRLQD
jgi:hypothetical protein